MNDYSGECLIVNLTPHPVTIGSVTIDPEDIPARASAKREKIASVKIEGNDNPTSINVVTFGDIEGLPDPKPQIFYLVSRIVAEACPDRKDLLMVDETIRDEKGRIVAASSLSQMP